MSEAPWNIWTGHVARLRAIEPGDWVRYHADANDSQSARENDVIHVPRSAEAAKKWAEEWALKAPEDESYGWAIESLVGAELVGMISTNEVLRKQGTFQYGLGVFREHRRRGYASEAIRLVLRYYFEELRFHRVGARVYAFNEASLALHRAMGFIEEGRIRAAVFTGGAHHAAIAFGMTATEFQERHGDSLPGPL